MNNKGFTLVEIISVVTLLAIIIIITVPIIGNVSENIKKSTLNTKIENIEKSAVLYGQANREKFNTSYNLCNYCKDDEDVLVENCYCYGTKSSSETITVKDLLDEGKIKEDTIISGEKVITNSVDENKHLNGCEIQIYKKYDKIYAVYKKTIGGTENLDKCFYTE